MFARILAIDTTTEACSVALMINDHKIFKKFIITPRKHTQHILPMIDNLLIEAGVWLNDLDALAFSRGPGSFTGTRIGIGIVQGLGLGVNLPLIGVSMLATLAEGAWRQTGMCKVLIAIYARMGEVYWAQYHRQASGLWLGEDSETVVSLDDLSVLVADLTGSWAIAGNGWQTYPKLVENDQLHLIHSQLLLPRALDMLPLASYYYNHNDTILAEEVQPTYLLNNVTWKNI